MPCCGTRLRSFLLVGVGVAIGVVISVARPWENSGAEASDGATNAAVTSAALAAQDRDSRARLLDPKGAVESRRGPATLHIDNISFAYREGTDVLKTVSLRAKPGTTTTGAPSPRGRPTP